MSNRPLYFFVSEIDGDTLNRRGLWVVWEDATLEFAMGPSEYSPTVLASDTVQYAYHGPSNTDAWVIVNGVVNRFDPVAGLVVPTEVDGLFSSTIYDRGHPSSGSTHGANKDYSLMNNNFFSRLTGELLWSPPTGGLAMRPDGTVLRSTGASGAAGSVAVEVYSTSGTLLRQWTTNQLGLVADSNAVYVGVGVAYGFIFLHRASTTSATYPQSCFVYSEADFENSANLVRGPNLTSTGYSAQRGFSHTFALGSGAVLHTGSTRILAATQGSESTLWATPLIAGTTSGAEVIQRFGYARPTQNGWIVTPPRSADKALVIYGMDGQLVATLSDTKIPGDHTKHVCAFSPQEGIDSQLAYFMKPGTVPAGAISLPIDTVGAYVGVSNGALKRQQFVTNPVAANLVRPEDVGKRYFYGVNDEDTLGWHEISSVGELVIPVGSDAGVVTIDRSIAAVYEVTLNENVTQVLLENVPSDSAVSITFILKHVTTGRTVTWPTNFKWPDGQQPQLGVNGGDIDVVTALSTDGGTTWLAALAGAAFK
jgi:hypothetical protein